MAAEFSGYAGKFRWSLPEKSLKQPVSIRLFYSDVLS
jgi:hypothetical protein